MDFQVFSFVVWGMIGLMALAVLLVLLMFAPSKQKEQPDRNTPIHHKRTRRSQPEPGAKQMVQYDEIVRRARAKGLQEDGRAVFVPATGSDPADLAQLINVGAGQHGNGWLVRVNQFRGVFIATVRSNEDLRRVCRKRYRFWK